MKGLLITGLIIAVLIGGGFLVSFIIYNNLANQLDNAYAEGFEEGQEQGYTIGLQDGGTTGYQEGSRMGYEESGSGRFDDGYQDGYYFAYNPAYDQLPEILAEASENSAKGIHNYAEANGVRVAYVRAQLARPAPEGIVYVIQLVAFETVDNGFVILEPWSGREVKVEVGFSYSQLNELPARPYDDTITKISVVW